MDLKIEKLFRLIKDMLDKKRTAQVRINFTEGNLSKKIEVKESFDLE